MMIIVPVRKVEEAEGGITCLLGSEPNPNAEREFLPTECVTNRVGSELGDLSVLTLDGSKLPERIRKVLGLG
jgi:hypothetical protein